MRSGGFPCRFGGCDVRYFVSEPDSLPALLAASAERTAHELGVHDYKHLRLDELVKRPLWTVRKPAKP